MTGVVRPRSMAGLVARLGGGSFGRDQPTRDEAAALSVPERVLPTREIGILVDALRSRESPLLLDLGRAVGENVAFYTTQLGCRLVVADLFADLDERLSAGEPAEGRNEEWIAGRIRQDPESVDALLCWDTLEHFVGCRGADPGREADSRFAY